VAAASAAAVAAEAVAGLDRIVTRLLAAIWA
jgi:hypothetical protein